MYVKMNEKHLLLVQKQQVLCWQQSAASESRLAKFRSIQR